MGLRDALKFQKTGLSQEYNPLARKALDQQNLGLPVTHFKKELCFFRDGFPEYIHCFMVNLSSRSATQKASYPLISFIPQTPT